MGKEIEKLKPGTKVYLNPERNAIFDDPESGVKLGTWEGWSQEATVPELPEEKLGILQRGIEHGLLLLKPYAQPERDNIVEDDPAKLEAAREILSHPVRVVETKIKGIDSEETLALLKKLEQSGKNRKTITDLIDEVIVAIGEKVGLKADIEEDFAVKNLKDGA